MAINFISRPRFDSLEDLEQNMNKIFCKILENPLNAVDALAYYKEFYNAKDYEKALYFLKKTLLLKRNKNYYNQKVKNELNQADKLYSNLKNMLSICYSNWRAECNENLERLEKQNDALNIIVKSGIVNNQNIKNENLIIAHKQLVRPKNEKNRLLKVNEIKKQAENLSIDNVNKSYDEHFKEINFNVKANIDSNNDSHNELTNGLETSISSNNIANKAVQNYDIETIDPSYLCNLLVTENIFLLDLREFKCFQDMAIKNKWIMCINNENHMKEMDLLFETDHCFETLVIYDKSHLIDWEDLNLKRIIMKCSKKSMKLYRIKDGFANFIKKCPNFTQKPKDFNSSMMSEIINNQEVIGNNDPNNTNLLISSNLPIYYPPVLFADFNATIKYSNPLKPLTLPNNATSASPINNKKELFDFGDYHLNLKANNKAFVFPQNNVPTLLKNESNDVETISPFKPNNNVNIMKNNMNEIINNKAESNSNKLDVSDPSVIEKYFYTSNLISSSTDSKQNKILSSAENSNIYENKTILTNNISMDTNLKHKEDYSTNLINMEKERQKPPRYLPLPPPRSLKPHDTLIYDRNYNSKQSSSNELSYKNTLKDNITSNTKENLDEIITNVTAIHSNIEIHNNDTKPVSINDNTIKSELNMDNIATKEQQINDSHINGVHDNIVKKKSFSIPLSIELSLIKDVPSHLVNQSENRFFCGLKNMSNTCYLNSVLQCLSSSQILINYLTRKISMNENLQKNTCLSYELLTIFTTLLKHDYKILAPTNFILNIKKRMRPFCNGQQHDAHEFLIILIDTLNDEIKEYCTEDDVFEKLFQGQFISTIECMSCNYQSATTEPFNCLSLPIQEDSNHSALADSINLLIRPETMNGSNKWKCPKCEDYKDAVKILNINELPPILLVHFKRFECYTNKITAHVSFSQQLILKTINKNKRNSKDFVNHNYQLIGVVLHLGESVDKGHYVSLVKRFSQWFTADDHMVTPANPNKIQNSDAYILLYEKT